MDNTDQNIKFDQNGFCDHCQNFFKNIKPILKKNTEKINVECKQVVTNIEKSINAEGYNCLIGVSGGVDSSFLLHLAVKKFNLRPLVVHVDTGWNSQTSVNNIEKLVDKLNLDLHTEVINWREMKDLQISFFKAGHPNLDIPQDHAIWAATHKLAVKKKIKYLLTGGNLTTECVREPLEWSYHASDLKHIRDVHAKFGAMKLENFPFCDIFTYRIKYRILNNLNSVQLLNFVSYTKESAIDLLTSEYGWQNYKHKHYESRFTRFFEGFWLKKKFGFDIRRVHFSSLILSGQMSREKALSKLTEDNFTEEEIINEINFIKSKLDFTENEFQKYFNNPPKSFRDYKSNYRVIQFLIIICKLLRLEKRLIRC